jgi:hypothetical protein
MKPHVPYRARRRPWPDEQHRSRPESILGEVGVEIDDHLPPVAVRACDTADEEEIDRIVIRHP